MSSPTFRRLPAPTGREWANDPSHDTYTIPNARCPVCGDSVFFYQSPFGGRVFFDELGPPWPKHGCTDSQAASFGRDPILPPWRDREPRSQGGKWRPLFGELVRKSGFDFVTAKSDALEFVLALPENTMGEAPIFWRANSKDAAMIDVSTVTWSGTKVIEKKIAGRLFSRIPNVTAEAIRQIVDWASAEQHVLEVYLYGRRARGVRKPRSPIELALVLAGDQSDTLLRFGLQWQRNLSVRLTIGVKHLELARDKASPAFDAVRDNGILLHRRRRE